MAIVTVNLGCQSDQIESHLENWFSTLLGAPVRVFQGWLAWTSTNWGWKTYPKCGQHSSIGRDPDGTKTRKKSACVQAWFFLRWCGVAASFTDSSFFSLWRWTHTSNSPGSFRFSALNYSCTIGPSCSEAFSFLDWEIHVSPTSIVGISSFWWC
jgi:hypothetical protein